MLDNLCLDVIRCEVESRRLKSGGHQRIEVAAEADERPYHQGYQEQKDDEDDGRLPGSLVYLSDDGPVAVYEPLNHLHVLDVGTMEEVDDVANEERYHAHQHITESIVQHGQRQRNALDDPRREIDKRHDAEQGDGIAPARNDADECIEMIPIHVARQNAHRLIGFVAHQPLAP